MVVGKAYAVAEEGGTVEGGPVARTLGVDGDALLAEEVLHYPQPAIEHRCTISHDTTRHTHGGRCQHRQIKRGRVVLLGSWGAWSRGVLEMRGVMPFLSRELR